MDLETNLTTFSFPNMVVQRELDERLRVVDAQLLVEERDWQDEERKLFELEETYLRETTVHGNVFTGWGEAKTAPIRFRNAALRRKKRERTQEPPAPLTQEEQLKIDKHRVASYSSLTSPAEALLATIPAREATATGSTVMSPRATATTVMGETKEKTDRKTNKTTAGKPSPAKKKARKQ